MSSIINNVFGLWSEYQMFSRMVPSLFREVNRSLNPSAFRSVRENDPDLPESLAGKVCVMTGGTRGIGSEVAVTFLRKGCHVITGTSQTDEEQTESRRQKILEKVSNGKGKLDILHVDLRSMSSTMEFVKKIKEMNVPIHYLINCAGIMFEPFGLTEDGFEKHLSINYFSHALITWHLLPTLAKSARQSGDKARIVNVSSVAHFGVDGMRWSDLQSKSFYSQYFAYGQSKLAQVMFTYKLVRWLESRDQWKDLISVFAIHPGIVNSDLLRTVDVIRAFPQLRNLPIVRSVKVGAETIIYAALSSQLNNTTGKYLEDSAVSNSSPASHSEAGQNKLWTITWALLDQWKPDDIRFDEFSFFDVTSILFD